MTATVDAVPQNGSTPGLSNGIPNGHVTAPVKVVVCGAGPAGLLLAHYLISFGKGKFQVIIHDKGEDPRETLKQGLNWRRFTIGISKRGQNSMDLIPGLLSKVKKQVVSPDSFAMLLPFMTKPLIGKATEKDMFKGWVVDRFSLCASLTTALEELYPESLKSGLLQLHHRSSCTGVDLQKQAAFFSSDIKSNSLTTENYDLLVGADGLRSVVRSSFQQQIRGFEVQQQNIPGRWTVTHYQCPEGYSTGSFHMIPEVPNSGGLQALGLPSQEGSLCFILGWAMNQDPKEWLACSSPAEAKDFLNARLPYLTIPEEAAWELRSTPLQTSAQVKCWQYHDTKGHAVVIGDAAHATSPNIGQGCNASLVDACVLARLVLGEEVGEGNRCPDVAEFEGGRKFWHKDPSPEAVKEKLPDLLTRFSALQVKEGHALVDVSASNGPLNRSAKMLHTVLFLLQFFINKLLPFLVSPPAMMLAGQTTMPLSEVYKKFKWQTDYILASDETERQQWYKEVAQRELAKKLA